MNTLFFDTETTGIPHFALASDDESQPHIVQLGLVERLDDGSSTEMEVIVRPDGWTIPDETIKIHGISQDKAMMYGISEDEAATLYVMAAARCDLRVAHNISFDDRIMRIAMVRAGFRRDFITFMEARASACTMRQSAPVVRIPPTKKMLDAGLTSWKSPSLSECVRHFAGNYEDLTRPHSALSDARSCAFVYDKLRGSAA